MLGINYNPLEKADVQPFIERNRYTFTPLQAPDKWMSEFQKAAGSASMNYLLDREGRVIYLPDFDGLESMERAGRVIQALLSRPASPPAGGAAAPRPAVAQSDNDPTVWALKPMAAQVAPGAKFTANLTAKIAAGWHVYSITQPPGGPVATVITVPKGQPFTQEGAIRGTMPEQAYDSNFDMQTEFYEENASFKVPLQVAASTPAGPKTLGVDVYFQVCNDRLCLPPATVRVPLTVTIAADNARRKPSKGSKPVAPSPPAKSKTSSSSV